jgi:hypothetical protein
MALYNILSLQLVTWVEQNLFMREVRWLKIN